VKANKVYFVTL